MPTAHVQRYVHTETDVSESKMLVATIGDTGATLMSSAI